MDIFGEELEDNLECLTHREIVALRKVIERSKNIEQQEVCRRHNYILKFSRLLVYINSSR